MTAGLESRVGDYNMTGGNSGAHTGHKKGYHEMNAKEFNNFVSGIHDEESEHYIKDLPKRVDEVEKIHKTYLIHKSRLEHEVTEGITLDKIDLKELQKKHDALRETYGKRIAAGKNTLTKKQTEIHMKELLAELLPQLGYGVKGEDKERSYDIFKGYISYLKQAGYEGIGQLEKQLGAAIASGNGAAASETILEIIKTHEVSKYQQSVLKELVDPDDTEFKHKYGEKIGKTIKDKTGIEVIVPDLIENLQRVAQAHADGKYLTLAEQYGKAKKTEHASSAPTRH